MVTLHGNGQLPTVIYSTDLSISPYTSTLECISNNYYTSAMETVKPYHLACLLPRQPKYRHKGNNQKITLYHGKS